MMVNVNLNDDRWMIVLLFIGSTITAGLSSVLYWLSKRTIITPNPQSLDITVDLYGQIVSLLSPIMSAVSLVSFILSIGTIYNAYTYRSLVSTIRIYMIAENLTRLLICFIQAGFGFCFQFNICPDWLNTSISFMISWYINYPTFVFCNSNCQMLISINRFFAINFDGIYAVRVQRYPYLQLMVALLLGIALFFMRMNMIWALYLPTILYAFSFVMDMITFIKFKKRIMQRKKAEKRILFQMATNQAAFLVTYFILPAILLIVLIFFGLWISFTIEACFTTLTLCINTLGQTLSNLILIREQKTKREEETVSMSTTKTPPLIIIKDIQTNRLPTPRK